MILHAHATLLSILLPFLIAVPGTNPQTPQTAATSVQLPAFDVISVRPNKTTPNGAYGLVTTQFTDNGFRAINVPVHVLLQQAYGLHEGEIVNEPAWVNTDVFDIEAKVAAPDVAAFKALDYDRRQAMFQQILAERFQLVAHRETRDLPVYAMSVANPKTGPKFKQSAIDPANSARGAGHFGMSMGRISAQGTSIPYFLGMLSRQLGRTIIDRTGLTGNYDFTLQWAPDNGTTASIRDTPDALPSIFVALQEQLGLKLESTKAPIEVLVIDHIERPLEN